MTTKNTHAPTTRAHQAVADDKKAGRTDSTLRKILAGQRAKQAADAGKERGAGPDPRRDEPRREGSGDAKRDAKHDGDKPGEHDAEWARHVEWTLRLMS